MRKKTDSVCKSVHMCLCVCVCVREREREEKEGYIRTLVSFGKTMFHKYMKQKN